MHNLTINLQNFEEKCYDYNSSYDYLIKQTATGSETQFALSRIPFDLSELQAFLGEDISLDDVFVDTYDFQTATFWLMTEDSEVDQLVCLYQCLIDKYEISEEDFLYWAGYLNNINLTSLHECAEKKCIACIRVPLQSKRLKIYARPFRYHSFSLDEEVIKRVKEVLNCDEKSFKKQLNAGGVSYDFSDGRIVLFTQNDELKKGR